MLLLSVVIPCFNEEKTISTLIEKIQFSLQKATIEHEIIVVDDGSSDQSANIVGRLHQNVILLNQKNQGKGAAVRNGVSVATGDFIIVQDADLEYDPNDIPKLLKHAALGSAVYGTRMIQNNSNGKKYRFPDGYAFSSKIASVCLSIIHFLLYGRWLSDCLTGYKIYPRQFYIDAKVETNGFETDHELTAKLFRSNSKIIEIPIRYYPRTVADGKKIGVADFFIAIYTIFRFRFNIKND